MEINCDLGEQILFLENGVDEAFMARVDAINIACTYHAGSAYIIEKTMENALKAKVHIGFHPGFNDKENFGRKEIQLSFEEIKNLIFDQYNIIYPIANRLGATIRHLKPHGALYNMAAANVAYARAIAQATLEIDTKLILLGLSGSFSISEAKNIGLSVQNEVFADRAYTLDGQLVARNIKGAVYENMFQVEEQVRSFFEKTKVKTIDNTYISLEADTICVHSDTQAGLEIAQLLQKIKHEKI